MVIISMLLAMGLFLVVLVGILIVLIGIILGIIAIVKRKKKSGKVLGIIAIVLIVIGLVVAVVPHFFIEGASAVKDYSYNKELSGFDEDEIAHVSHYMDLDEGFEYKGVHYDRCPDNFLTPKGDKEEAGAIVYDNDKHTMLYKADIDYDSSNIIYTEGSIFCPGSEIDDMLDYYRNKAALHGKIYYISSQKTVEAGSDELDLEMIRKIRDYIEENGTRERHDGFSSAREVHMDFYSDDMIYWLSLGLKIKHDAVEGTCDDVHAVLPDEYADYIRTLAFGED